MQPQPIGMGHLQRLAAAVLVSFVVLPLANAQSVTVNFDSVATPSGAVMGAPVTSYLAGYGITLANITPGADPYIRSMVSSPWAAVSSAPNVFSVAGPSPYGVSFDMVFAGGISNFSFDRRGNLAAFSPSGSINGPWTATAYDIHHNVLGSVGEPLIATYGNIPVQTFSLSFAGIHSISWSATALGFAGTQMPEIDSMSFTAMAPIPEPETYAMMLAGLALLGWQARRRRGLPA